ncbi:hypothetical protein Goklo_013016, partial [Gossypium klotzschianum]|nr:hypothetical protein [Gossypium klotzschianum]
VYIAYLGPLPDGDYIASSHHSNMLQALSKHSQTVNRNAAAESNVIVGVIDTGICPESDIFSDEGFGAPPQKWKGACKVGQNFTCNK